jgi:hypothetical protein
MRTPLKTTLAAALPLVSLLWLTPPAVAHDSYRSHEHRRSWSESYRHPYTGRYSDWERYRGYNRSGRYGENQRKYSKAMDRLARQERQARTRAYRRYGEGEISDRRYQRRLAEIDRKYDYKRDKVERNWGYGR